MGLSRGAGNKGGGIGGGNNGLKAACAIVLITGTTTGLKYIGLLLCSSFSCRKAIAAERRELVKML